MFETRVLAGVCQLYSPEARWLGTGPTGGYHTAPAAYNVTVPEGFDRTDLDAYATQRLDNAGLESPGPALFTGVDTTHARCARSGDVLVLATAGLSNPATLEPGDGPDGWQPGTVNLLVGTGRSLSDGALATLLATVTEAKAATLLELTGFTGTTTDAVVAGCTQSGAEAAFAGSGTDIGAAARRCTRDGVRASLESRYADTTLPDSVEDAEFGVVTDGETDVFDPN